MSHDSFLHRERVFVKLVRLISRERALGKRKDLHAYSKRSSVSCVSEVSLRECCRREGKSELLLILHVEMIFFSR